MMVFPGARLFRELQLGALRKGGGRREAGSTVAESLVVLYRLGTHQIRQKRRRAARSSTSRGRAEPCARESKVQTRRFLREKLIMSNHGHFASYEGRKEWRTGKIRGAFIGMLPVAPVAQR